MLTLCSLRGAGWRPPVAAVVLGGLIGAWPAIGQAFSLADVDAQARTLAQQPYVVPQSNLPPALRDLHFADYQKIRFDPSKAFWVGDPTPFTLQFYHQGMHYDLPVTLNQIDDTGVHPIEYRPQLFDFDSLQLDPAVLEGLGFAGFKVLYPLNELYKQDELVTFLGASYLRAVGRGQWYGLSARGLAIDTALPSGEEFPRFTEFWIEHPQPEQRYLVVYALLDSPRATGAYRLVITPGVDTTLDVEARVYFREAVQKLGLAPLTSMFLYGPNQPPEQINYRPAIHDSEGLAIATGSGERIWRPLNDPRKLSISSFSVENPRGFGLMQRSRAFDDYQDLDDRYELRPSGWVETKGDWGKGTVELVEIPTRDETNDNIVAYWKPEQLPGPGEPLAFAYRLHFTSDEAALRDPGLAWVSQTRRSTGEVKQPNLIRQPDGSIAYVVEFVGPTLNRLLPQTPLRAQVSVDDNGELVDQQVRHNPVTGGWRLITRVRVKDPHRPVEMRAALYDGEQVISETWSNQVPASE